MKPVLTVNNLSKRYLLGAGTTPYLTLRDSIVTNLKKAVTRGANGSTQELIALRDVTFEVQPGEAVGIIGKNGAGKSTLLKILSRITEPTQGRVEIFGRIGSLLEVGTGFHPELSGRENIYLNGAVLGMKRSEIRKQFDAIVDFAGVAKFIDTPVKRYSSGMYMRLAFSVAAHLEPEVLLVDEVLAVGDAEFQQKCLGKMRDVRRHGRTVLFVSHNMPAVAQLCTRGILLDQGRIAHIGGVHEVVEKYLTDGHFGGGEVTWDQERAPGNRKFKLLAARILEQDRITNEVNIDRDVIIEVDFLNLVPDTRNVCVNIYLLDAAGAVILSTGTTPAANAKEEKWFRQPHPKGVFRSRCIIPANFLNGGLHHITLYIVTLGPLSVEVEAPHVLSFHVIDNGAMREPGGGTEWPGAVRVRLPWETEFLGRDGGVEQTAQAEKVTT
jgi:lipopolysaccharide transport system ATP-binding protein